LTQESASRGGGLITAASGLAARASNQVFLIAVVLTATRYLGPAEFGVFSIAVIFTTLSRTLLYTGPSEFLLKASDPDEAGLACLLARRRCCSSPGRSAC
jgi:O-antigen/teichoic acid export membrane protein